jgi:hypothetical protein
VSAKHPEGSDRGLETTRRASFPDSGNISICAGRLEGRGALIDPQKTRRTRSARPLCNVDHVPEHVVYFRPDAALDVLAVLHIRIEKLPGGSGKPPPDDRAPGHFIHHVVELTEVRDRIVASLWLPAYASPKPINLFDKDGSQNVGPIDAAQAGC